MIEVLASMEHEGVKVDTAALIEYGRELNDQLVKVEEEARDEERRNEEARAGAPPSEDENHTETGVKP